jgi:hypothetical protein
VPVSWINRTIDMGGSSFRVVKVAPNYALALWEVLRDSRSYAGVRREKLRARIS